jgi:hypothetical protein
MRVTIEITPREHRIFREFFRLYGSAQPMLEETGMHRITLNRLLRTGRATSETVQKVRDYVQKHRTGKRES